MTTPLTTNILVADDHPIVLRGLRMVLDAEPDRDRFDLAMRLNAVLAAPEGLEARVHLRGHAGEAGEDRALQLLSRVPIVQTIFQSGEFSGLSTNLVADPLALLAIGPSWRWGIETLRDDVGRKLIFSEFCDLGVVN